MAFAATSWFQIDLLIEILGRLRDKILSDDDIYVQLLFRAVVLDATDLVRETVKYISYTESRVIFLLNETASYISVACLSACTKKIAREHKLLISAFEDFLVSCRKNVQS